MIIEADNNPLVKQPLRELLRSTYPKVQVNTLKHVGHFPYLNDAQAYTNIVRDFMQTNPQ